MRPELQNYRVLHESLYGYIATGNGNGVAVGAIANGDVNKRYSPIGEDQQQKPQHSQITANTFAPYPAENIDTDLAMAIQISEQEQKQLQEDLKREQEMLEEVLRLSLEEK